MCTRSTGERLISWHKRDYASGDKLDPRVTQINVKNGPRLGVMYNLKSTPKRRVSVCSFCLTDPSVVCSRSQSLNHCWEMLGIKIDVG